MRIQVLNFKTLSALSLVCILLLEGCTSGCSKVADSQQDKYLYKIENPALREMLIAFNNEFKNH